MALNYAMGVCVIVLMALRTSLFATNYLVYEIESVGRVQFSGIASPDEWFASSAGVLEIPAYVEGCPVVSVKGRACFSNQIVRKIKFGRSIQSIHRWAFANCSNLTEVVFADEASSEGRHVVISSFAFAKASRLKNVEFPDSLMSIGSDAFMDCCSLVAVVLPSGVTMVSDGAFSHCRSLESVRIPATVEMMDDAFSIFTPKLRDIDLSEDNPYYFKKDDAIYSRERRELVLYPRVTTNKVAKIVDGTEWVRGFAFFQCKGIEFVDFPSTVKVICEGAFGCSTLKRIVMPVHLDTISDRAFAECTDLAEVVFRSHVKYIGEDAFGGCHALKRVEVYAKPFDIAFNKQFPSDAVFFVHGYHDEWLQFSAKTGRRIETVLDSNLRK